MEDNIRLLEAKAAGLEILNPQYREWTQAVFEFAEVFLKTLPEQKAFQNEEFNPDPTLSISEEGKPIAQLLPKQNKISVFPGLNPASGGHLGYIPGGGIFTAALGDFLAAVTNRFATVNYASPDAVHIENTLVKWLCELVAYPKNSFGFLSSGGSQANLTGIVVARDAKGINSKNIEKSVIYYTTQAHHCVNKAIRIAGLSEGIQRQVPMNKHFQMKVSALEELIKQDLQQGLKPWLIVASAGTTDAGAIDPLEEIAAVAKKYDLWLHADAAYGGFFLLTAFGQRKLKGLSMADSIVMDPHKGLFLPYGTGAVLVKNKKDLLRSFHFEANYMQDAETNDEIISSSEISPELSRHYRGLRLWLSLQLHGLKPFRAALEEKYLLAQYFYREIKEFGFQSDPEPELSVVLYRYVPKKIKNDTTAVNLFNQKLLKAILDDGRIFISSTSINNQFWLRLAVLSFRTHLSHIQLLLKLLKEKVVEFESNN